ncbi:MAG: acyltransferase [bacterium]
MMKLPTQIKKLNLFLETKLFNFDLLLSLRGLACLCVILFHITVRPSKVNQHPWLLWPFYVDATAAVWIFFILSGYLMTKLFATKKYNWTLQGLKKYYLARIVRIVPLYWFVVFIGSVLAHPELIKIPELPKLLSIFTFSQYLFTKNDFVYADVTWISQAWSLVAEVQYYLVAPVIAFLMLKAKPIAVYIVTLLLIYSLTEASVLGRFIDLNDLKFFRSVLPQLGFFFGGSLVVVILKNIQLKTTLRKFVFLLPVFVITLFIIPVIDKFQPIFLEQSIKAYFIIINTTLVIALFESFNYTNKPAVWDFSQSSLLNPQKYLEKLGHLSFGIYLWHLLVINSFLSSWDYSQAQYLPFKLGQNAFVAFRFMVILAVTFVISYITFHTIEQFGKKRNLPVPD